MATKQLNNKLKMNYRTCEYSVPTIQNISSANDKKYVNNISIETCYAFEYLSLMTKQLAKEAIFFTDDEVYLLSKNLKLRIRSGRSDAK